MYNRPIAVTSLEYYREQDQDSRRENMQYYTDNETISREHGLMGEWEIFQKDGAEPLCAGMVQGAQVQWDVIEPLSKGENPDTGESYGIQRNSDVKVSAEDWTVSAPKPYSVFLGIAKANSEGDGPEAELWGKVAEIFLEGHRRGGRVSMEHAFNEEVFAARFGKGGKERAGVSFIGAARFDHFTSRDGDMQLHSHWVIPKVARAPDGSVRSWDNHKMTVLRGKMSALYRAEAVSYVTKELDKLGIKISFSKDGRNFKIDGMDKAIPTHFSKRRTAILKQMYEKGYNNTRDHRAAAQIASFATRRSKSELPPMPVLYDRWNFELKQLGYTPAKLLESITQTAKEKETEKEYKFAEMKAKAAENGDVIPTIRPDFDHQAIALDAVKNITAMEAVFERSKFETEMLEHLQFNSDAATALATIEAVRDQGSYVRVGVKGRSKEGVFTDAKTLSEEFELIELETAMRGNVAGIDPRFIEQAIKEGVTKNDGSGERFQLRDEQADLVRHLLSGNQRTDGIGDAGTGKTTSMTVLRRALELASEYEVSQGRAPYKLYLVAPTNKAVSGLCKELGLPIENGFSVTRFVMDAKKGKLELDEKTIVLGDEWGMVSRSDHLDMLHICKATGNRLAAVGDPKQLQAVQAGAPFRMTTEAFGAGRLMEIARQKEAWARQASKDLANGNVRDGIMAHADRGGVEILDSAEEVYERGMQKAMEWELEAPGSVLVLSPTNEERRSLARQLIEKKMEAGILTGEQYFIDHADRGTDEIQNSLFMVGSVVALAETVTYNDERFPNNAMGTITKIEPDGDKEPYLTVKWEDGRTVTFKPSTFVGFREEGDPLAKVPKFAPADCLTEYQAQGLTTKNVVRIATGPMSTQSAYVSMTRQKDNLLVLVDGSRIEADLAAKQGKVFTMGKDGSSRQEDDVPNAVITKEQKLDRFIEEAERTNSKANACDFLGGAKSFHQNYRNHYEAGFKLTNDLHNPEIKEERNMQNKEDDTLSKSATNTADTPKRPMPRGIGRMGAKVPEVETSKAAKELAEIAERRTNATAAPEIAKSPKVQSIKEKIAANRLQREQAFKNRKDQENHFLNYGVNLYEYALSKGAFIKEKTEKTHIKPTGKGTEYSLTWGPGRGLEITQYRDGRWEWWDRSSGEGGNLVNFYQFVNNLAVTKKSRPDPASYKKAMDGLRSEFGLGTRDFSQVAAPTYKPVERGPELFGRARYEADLEKIKAYDPKKIARNERGWSNGLPIRNGYYADDLLARGIGPKTQENLFEMGVLKRENPKYDDIQNAGTMQNPVWEKIPNKNARGWIVKMQSVWHSITGYIRKGPDGMEPGTRLSLTSSSSQRALVSYGNMTDPSRFVVDESISDSFTRYEREGHRKDTMYLATGGQIKAEEEAMIYDLATRHPGKEWAIGKQYDAANERFCTKVNAAVQEGDQAAKIGYLEHSPEFKDISEQHKAENAERIKADLAKYGRGEKTETKSVSPTPSNAPTRPVPQRPEQPVARPVAAKPEPVAEPKRPVPQKPEQPRSKWKPAGPAPDAAQRRIEIEEQQRRERELAAKSKGPSL